VHFWHFVALSPGFLAATQYVDAPKPLLLLLIADDAGNFWRDEKKP
jgi:hypothetical protein